MRGAVSPLPQYAFMVWCSVKAQEQLYLYIIIIIIIIIIINIIVSGVQDRNQWRTFQSTVKNFWVCLKGGTFLGRHSAPRD
jgi:DNA-binding transcriptional regulator of glucitol operon